MIAKKVLEKEIIENKKTFVETAKILCVSAETVSKWCKKYKIQKPKKQYNYKAIVKDFENGTPLIKIGEKYNIPRHKIAKILSELGIYTSIKKNSANIIQKYLSKENLEKAYSQGYSSNYIATKYFYPEFTTSAGTVIERAKKLGITTPDLNMANGLKTVIDQRKQTYLDKTGFISPSQNPKIKEKKRLTNQKNWGVDNVFQSSDIKKRLRKTRLEKYGTLGPTKSLKNISEFEKEVALFVSDLGFDVKTQVNKIFKKWNSYKDAEYDPRVDILLIKYKLVIECYGTFCHADPREYSKEDILYLWDGKVSAKDVWEKDKNREKQIKSFGFDLKIIWYYDWYKTPGFKEELKCELLKLKKLEN